MPTVTAISVGNLSRPTGQYATETVKEAGINFKYGITSNLTFERAAFSPVISEGFDRSDGIYDRDTGDVIAQGELGLPIFVGVMQFTTRAVIERARDLAPGDIFLVNDPYCGGTHLMDVKMVKPFFYGGQHWAWLANTGHWPDTGGSVPGGFSTRATEVQQEGLAAFVKFSRGGNGPDILDRPRQHPGAEADRRHQGPGGRPHRW
jgi:N-methylhydantoinase B